MNKLWRKLDELSEKVELISRKWLTKDLIDKCSILNGANYFSSDELQNYLVFISTTRIYWISKDGSNSEIESWKSTEMSRESIKTWHTSDISFALKLNFDYRFKTSNFKGIYLNQDSVSFLHEKCFKFVYFTQIRNMFKMFKYRFYTR